jgi:energy-converting hydrogenase Eha subunit E
MSRVYAIAQTVLLTAFAVVVLFIKGPLLFSSGMARGVGLALSAIGVALIFLAFRDLRHVIQIAPEPKAGGSSWHDIRDMLRIASVPGASFPECIESRA